MRILKSFFNSAKANKPVNPAKLAKAKSDLAKLSQADLKAVFAKEEKKAGDLLGKLGMRKSVPTVIQALSDLHRGAMYMRDGQVAPQTVFVDLWRNAFAFTNKRHAVATQAEYLKEKRHDFAQPQSIKEWRKNIVTERDVDAAVGYGAARVDLAFDRMYSFKDAHPGKGVVVGGAKMSNLSYYEAAQKLLGEDYVAAWAGLSPKYEATSPKKVNFAEVKFALEPSIIPAAPARPGAARTNSSASIERGGLAFDAESPVSVSALVAKIGKKEGKKADR